MPLQPVHGQLRKLCPSSGPAGPPSPLGEGKAGWPGRACPAPTALLTIEKGNNMAKEAKTNAMRMLERAKVAYTSHEYPHE